MIDAFVQGIGKVAVLGALLALVLAVRLLFAGGRRGTRLIGTALAQREFFRGLERIAELRDSGVYSTETFEKRKRELIDALIASAPDKNDEAFLVRLARHQRKLMLTPEDIHRIRSTS